MSSTLKTDATEENKASAKNGVKRLIFVGIALLVEVVINVAIVLFLGTNNEWVSVVLHIIAAVFVLVIYNQNKTSAMKIPWIILLMAVPLLGMTLYLLIGLNPGMRAMRERYEEVDKEILPLLQESSKDGLAAGGEAIKELEEPAAEGADEKATEGADKKAADAAEKPVDAAGDNAAEGADEKPAVAAEEGSEEDDEASEDYGLSAFDPNEPYVVPAPAVAVASEFNILSAPNAAEEHLREIDQGAANIARYLDSNAHYPAYENVDIEYYDDASKGIEAQKEDMRKAEKFIFMEYHAIENAESWKSIQEVLEDRVKAGVEVRVFYDDIGSIGFIDTDFVNLMNSKGIKCRVFNPFSLGLNLFLNNRDHRKITVIDGRVGFTGGYNIANEYFNITHPFGHWKDTGVRITGPAVRSLTVMFLEMWNAIKGDDSNDTDYAKYLPDVSDMDQSPAAEAAEAAGGDAAASTQPDAETEAADGNAAASETAAESSGRRGFVIPYADLPLDDEHVGENVYISFAEYAQDYAWFVTPYLILTDEMTHALGLAAKRGVDVRIITPGIPDKPTIYSITRSYYHNLVTSGVRIYEYTPGFCHCKMSVADDKIALCGTINLDYRSLYHHFENACMYAHCDAVMDTKKDFISMMDVSREVTEEYKAPTAGKAFGQMILRLVAPLL